MAIVQADGMKHFDGQQNVMPEPNTNLMAPRTLIPTLMARIGKGETVLVSAVFGIGRAKRPETRALRPSPASMPIRPSASLFARTEAATTS